MQHLCAGGNVLITSCHNTYKVSGGKLLPANSKMFINYQTRISRITWIKKQY